MHTLFKDSALSEPEQPPKSLNNPFHNYGGHQAHQRVASADPFGFDDLFDEVPKLNRRVDVQGLVDLLHKMLGLEPGSGRIPPLAELPLRVNSWDYTWAAAAMRDLGIVLGSIRRHGEHPLELLPGLEPLLVLLCQKTDLAPRDTLLHYTLWNPDLRTRTYTSRPEELELIRSAQMAFPAFERAIAHLDELFEIPLGSVEFALTAQKIHYNLEAVREAAVHSFKYVDRRVFSRAIRPFFESAHAGGKELLGPGAVAIPLYIFDHILWGAQVTDSSYVKFKESHLPSTLPYLRKLYHRFSYEGCFLDRLLPLLLEHSPAMSPETEAGLRALDAVFTLIQRFRSVHLRVGEQTYSNPSSRVERGADSGRPDIHYYIFRLAARSQKRLQLRIPPSLDGSEIQWVP